MAVSHIAIIDRNGKPACDVSTGMVPWWSFTKTLMAAAALRLAEQGRLTLDENLAGLPYTLRQLLQHRAGVGEIGGCASAMPATSAQRSSLEDII
jgi:CubicO group peptidase (beta-lactamase class C family)